MPKKPRPTRLAKQRRIPNEHVTDAGGALMRQNAILAARAIELEMEDVAAGKPLRGRYSRVVAALVDGTGCSSSHAERAIAEGKLIRMERFMAELPTKRAEISLQLHRIADAQEEAHPVAAVAALREIAKINGLLAPKKIEITDGAPERSLAIDAVLAVLDDRDREDLRRILQHIEEAKVDGRLRSVDEPVDAEIVEPDLGN